MELTELCKELNNWFDLKRRFGTFVIDGGSLIDDVGLLDGQYYRIVGSVFNDGVHKAPAIGLEDEVFEGAVWLMAVPPAVLNMLDEINRWQEAYGESADSPYSSESFGGYSYTKKSGGGSSSTGNSDTYNWRNAFADRLNRWRKV